jgi:succinate-semialdehyde dehydrogenase/glutarate-semialdehyde dehydrogenase
MRGAAEEIKKLSLELGGHAPVIVFEDVDLEQAVNVAMIAKFRNTGQTCIAGNRIYVHRGVFERFIERFAHKARSLKMGNGLDDGVEIGPLIDQAALDHAIAQIDQAKQNGAKVLCGGRRWEGGKGYFLEPTVLVDVPEEADCMKEESFAPLAPVVAFDEEHEVIRRANDTRYGLAAYVLTRDMPRVWRVTESLEAGTVAVNEGSPATSQCPFGGMKQSGVGRELGIEGLDAYLETKHVSFGGID